MAARCWSDECERAKTNAGARIRKGMLQPLTHSTKDELEMTKGSDAGGCGRWSLWLVLALAWLVAPGDAPKLSAQASALPSAQATPSGDESVRGRKLMDAMVAALGGDAWLARDTERLEGRGATFYKGLPNPYESQFEEYLRLEPFGERVVIVSKQGVFIPTTKRDIAEVWTPENGYEVNYHGRKDLPKIDVEEFERRRRHSLDIVVRDWMKRPGTLVTFEGTEMDDRHLVDRVSVLTADNDGITLGLDQTSHLPRSRSFLRGGLCRPGWPECLDDAGDLGFAQRGQPQ